MTFPVCPPSITTLVEIEYFTDPLCCWSWGLEPQWRRLRFEFGTQLSWRYRMGGMIPDWDSYQDPINSINRRSQMAPLWYQARELSGMPLRRSPLVGGSTAIIVSGMRGL